MKISSAIVLLEYSRILYTWGVLGTVDLSTLIVDLNVNFSQFKAILVDLDKFFSGGLTLTRTLMKFSSVIMLLEYSRVLYNWRVLASVGISFTSHQLGYACTRA